MTVAGVPWFATAIFSRDRLIVALQSVLINPNLAKGTVPHLAQYQAKERDDWDAQAGKIVHEMRFGVPARVNETPHGPYYGTADTTMLFLLWPG